MAALSDALPALYASLLPGFFQREVPIETKATCANCAMCKTGARDAVESVDGVSRLFRPDTKCCTYYPRLPNYLVGALLRDDREALAEGRRRVREKIAARVGVAPQWLKPPVKYGLLYDSARQSFGRAASLRCPYFDPGPGSCTIWAYREAVCSTFFCKYVSGEDGRKFWMSLKGYLTLVEIQLSRWAVFQLHPELVLSGRDREPATALRVDDLDDLPPSDKAYREQWGEWVGREEEFYTRCAERVSTLSHEQVERLLGFDGEASLAVLEQLYRANSQPELPRALKLNASATVHWLDDGSVAMASYSEFDAVALPGEAYALLTLFNGREPVDAVRARMRKERSADLDEDVLRTLYHHRVLVEP